MDVMLQRHSAKYIYVVPEGLKELMTDISREVLRMQPENIYTFIADYLDALMITRENARVAARLVQSITEISTTTVEFLQEAGMERTDADRVAQIVHATFKKQLEDNIPAPEEIEEANIVTDIVDLAQIPPEKGEAAARIIQRAFRNFKLRREQEKELLSGMIDWRVAARSAIYLYRKTGVTHEEANRAATLIKAAYKGYYTRRYMKKLAAEAAALERLQDEELYGEYSDYERDKDGSKTVKIDYGSVIPHVDFGDSSIVPDSAMTEGYRMKSKRTPQDGSSTSVVVADTLASILTKTFETLGIPDDTPPPPPPPHPFEPDVIESTTVEEHIDRSNEEHIEEPSKDELAEGEQEQAPTEEFKEEEAVVEPSPTMEASGEEPKKELVAAPDQEPTDPKPEE